MRVARFAFFSLSVAGLAIASFLGLAETNLWWVRMTDFPRLQYLIIAIVLLMLLGLARGMSGAWRLGFGAILVLVIGFNGAKLAPYLPARSLADASCPRTDTFSIIVANVQLGNRRADALLDIVRTRRPDLLLALETDAWWDQQLGALSDDMPYSVEQITGGYFGMHLLSRLPLRDTEVVFPVKQDVPAIMATIELSGGASARLIGLHPRPPHPGESSTGRDAQLMWAALRAREAELPALVAGDLNAVPWERGVERLQRIGGLLDPRQQHGFQASYDAQSWWMTWPLDQVLHQSGLTVSGMAVLPAFGSDHYPVEVTLCHRRTALTAPPVQPDDLAEAERTIASALQRAAGGR